MNRATTRRSGSSRCWYSRRLCISGLVSVAALAAPSAIASNPGNPEIRATATASVHIGLSVRPTLSIMPMKFGPIAGPSSQSHLCLRSNSFKEPLDLRFEEGGQAVFHEKLAGSGARFCQMVYTLPAGMGPSTEKRTLVVIITPL